MTHSLQGRKPNKFREGDTLKNGLPAVHKAQLISKSKSLSKAVLTVLICYFCSCSRHVEGRCVGRKTRSWKNKNFPGHIRQAWQRTQEAQEVAGFFFVLTFLFWCAKSVM